MNDINNLENENNKEVAAKIINEFSENEEV